MGVENGDYSMEDIHGIFRCVHTIKGGSGTFGFTDLINFAHTFETLLDKLRQQKIELTASLISILLRGNDLLTDLVKSYQYATPVAKERSAELMRLMNEAMQESDGDAAQVLPSTQGVSTSFDKINITENDFSKKYFIRFIPKQDLMRFGNDPLLILRSLKELAHSPLDENYKITLLTEALPSLESFSAQELFATWDISLTTSDSINDIREIFEFVEDDCTLEIEEDTSTKGCLDKTAATKQLESKTAASPQALDPSMKSATNIQQPQADQVSVEAPKSIRVDLDRIDKLVNTVGEMVIKQAMVIDQAQNLSASNEGASSTEPLFKSLQELSQHTRELQESVMAIRAQPIKAVFSRFPRLVRELAMELSKDVHLELKGEGTEIDKTVIERLGEPLTHMIRNALDHGIETPEERIKAGKKAQGQILLNAEHRSGRIVIEISDDGKGIDRNRVLTKAKEQGIIKPDGVLPDEEIDQLIFHPGFSTAKEVTNISGRGVGMDVVKRSIQNLGGKINIQSKEGRGCIFTLTLPLTLAVMDGMIIACGEEFYVIPLIHIIETLRPTPIQVQPLIGNHDLLNIRGETIPLIYLFDVFSVKEAIQNPADSIVVVLETEGGEKYGLVVDEILGQQQVVLKSLESNYETIPGISAATILGNGHVALILDISTVKNLPPRHGIIFQTGLEQTCHKIAAAN